MCHWCAAREQFFLAKKASLKSTPRIPGLREALLDAGDRAGTPACSKTESHGGGGLRSQERVLSLFLMVMFFGATKIIPIGLDVFLLWAVWTNAGPA